MLEDMKITVCFGATKIIVPCGSELPVRELVQQAIVRYRKVTNKHADDYIRVHCLQTCDEGAILDEDDTVGDVLDDRDKIIASFEENLVTRPGHNGGDGTSTSSVGTASPDIFQGDARGPIEGIPIATNPYSNNRQPQRILDDYKHKNSLQVKYVEGFSPHSSHSTLTSGENHEATRENGGRHLEGRSSGSDYESVEHGDDDKDESDISAFKREPARKSLKSDHLDRWMDMQESYSEFKRHEPTGAPPSPVEKFTVPDSSTRISRQISLALSEPE